MPDCVGDACVDEVVVAATLVVVDAALVTVVPRAASREARDREDRVGALLVPWPAAFRFVLPVLLLLLGVELLLLLLLLFVVRLRVLRRTRVVPPEVSASTVPSFNSFFTFVEVEAPCEL